MINPKDNLTILLLVKDRFYFTKRWLEYATLTQQKFPIVVADGSSEDFLRYEVQKASGILDIEYLYPGPDKSISDFISKSIDSLRTVRTKYTYMASDDDFYFSEALEKSVKFSESHDDYVLCNGGALDFGLSVRPSLANSIFGQIRYVRQFGAYESFLEEDAVSRIIKYRKSNRSYWHSVITTECLLRSWEIAAELELTRYDTLEDFLNLYWLTQGKYMHLQNEIMLFHQVHNDMISQTLESESVRENDVVWKMENKRIEDCIAAILGGRQILRDHSFKMQSKSASKSSAISSIFKKIRDFFFIIHKKVKYKVAERFNIEPKLVLTGLQITENTLVQIKDIENFLKTRKQ